MGAVEQQERKARLDSAKAELREAMLAIPFDLSAAGALRVQAWKHAVHEAQKLLNRSPADASKYSEALRSIRECSSATNDVLAAALYRPETFGLPPYPEGDVLGPCVCGSWPGGKCLHCPVARVGDA